MKLSDAPLSEAVWFETGGLDSFIADVGESHGYRCSECGVSALERPLFVDAVAETAHRHDEHWAFYTESGDLRCGECGGAVGIEVGLPDDPAVLDELAERDEASDASPGAAFDGETDSQGDADDAAPKINSRDTSGAGGGDFRPEQPDREEGRDRKSSGVATDGLVDDAFAPTGPYGGTIPEVSPESGHGIGELASGGGRNGDSDDEAESEPLSDRLSAAALRLSGVRDVGVTNTFPGRVWSLAYRRESLVGLVVVLASLVAADIAGLAVGAALVGAGTTVVGLGSAVGGWGAIVGAALVGGYVVHLYDRDRRGWPHAPAESRVDPEDELSRLRRMSAVAMGAGAVGVAGAVAAGVAIAGAAVVGIAGGVTALQFRRFHVAAALEWGYDTPGAVLSGSVRLGVLAGAGLVVVASSLVAAVAAAVLPVAGILAIGEMVRSRTPPTHS